MAVSMDLPRPLGERLRVSVRHGRSEVLLAVDGELDLATIPRLEAALAGVLADGVCARVALDLADLGFLDASAIGCIVRAERRIVARGGTLVVLRPSRPARRLLELCDLGGLLREGHRTRPEAI